MKCVLAHPEHCLAMALRAVAATRSDLELVDAPACGDEAVAGEAISAPSAWSNAEAVIVPPLSDPARAEPADVYAHCDRVESLLEICRTRDLALVWCVSDALFEDGADGPIDESARPQPRDETLRRLVATAERVRHHPRHLVVRLGPLFAIDGEDAWLAPVIDSLLRGESLRGARDLILCPTSAMAVARALTGMLLQLKSGADAWGTYHLCGVEPVSAYTFLSVVRTQLDTRLEGVGERRTLGELQALNQHHDTPLRRVLNCRRLLDAFGIHQKSWRVELGVMLDSWCQRYASERDAAGSGQAKPGSHEEAADA